MQPASNSSGFPLSPQQRRLWLLRQGGAVYNSVMVLELRGPLVPSRLREALTEVVRRHDGLHSRYVQRNDLRFPLQASAGDVEIELEELSASTPEQRERLSQELALSGLHQSFEYGAAPLLRATLARLGEGDHLLRVIRPSLSGDAQSHCRFAEEVLAAYEGRELEEEPGLEHAQYAEWQNQLLAEPEPAAAEHWARATSLVKPLTLPFERLQRQGPFRPASVELRFDSGRYVPESLLAIARRWGVAPGSLLAAAWSAVAARWLEASELVLGFVEPARPYDELKRVQGLLAKMVPIAVPLAAEAPLRDAVRAIEQSLEQSRDWIEHLAWDTAPEVPQNSLPVGFEFQEARLGGPEQGSVRGRVERLLGASESFVLKLSCVDDSRGISCEVIFDENAVDAASAKLAARMVVDFLASVAREPDAPLRGHSLLDQAALLPVAGPEDEGARPRTVVELFEDCAAAAPGTPALIQRNRTLSYAELNAEANRLSRHLRSLGVGPEAIVAVAADRSIETVVAMFAILKAGGAFLLIDPSYPPERITYMLGDAKALLALGAGERREAFSAAPRFLALDTTDRPWLQESAENLSLPVAPETLAYVLYTSGSTGQPKGCQLEVRNLSHYIGWANASYFEDGRARGNFGLFTSLSFDLTLTSVFCALTRGRTLHVFDGATETLEVLRSMFSEGSEIDVVKMTPSHISLVDTLGLARTGVQKVIAGGEALTHEHISILRRLNPDIQIYNEYGPTETTVGCVVKRVEPGDERILIGVPIARTQLLVVDEAGKALPPLVAGELLIAGEGVGRGYANAPERTASKFVLHPGLRGRAYRTGDKVRILAHGELDYLGRIDDQVKVRGHRIEPGEIEQHLLRHPAVKQVLVMARRVRGPEPELVAYVVTAGEVPATELRELLRRTLPEHMVPGWFVRMEQMPLTQNGKIHRAALPEPEQAAARSRVLPRTQLEERIAQVWRAVLGLEEVGIHDGFAELGGHSLKAMQVVGRLGQELGMQLSLRELLDNPTIEGLAALAERRSTSSVQVIPSAPAQEHYALSDAQRRLWTLEQMDGPGSVYLISAAFVLEGELEIEALRRALAALVARHEPLRTSFHEVEGEPRQRVHAHVELPVELVPLLGASVEDARVQEHVARITSAPFELTRAPLLRVQLLQLAGTRHLLVFAMHHIISDGWSVAVMARELAHLYAAERTGQAASLPPLRIHYKDYSHWQNGRLAGPEGEALRRYWHEKLRDPPPALDLPIEHPRPPVRTYRGGSVVFRLSAAETAALEGLGRRQDATLFMALVASVKALLYRYTGQGELVVGTAIAGRSHPDVEHHIGAYLNMLVLRDTVRGQEGFTALLDSVRRTAREAYEQAEYPFDRLVRELDVVRDASRSPLFDVLVVLQNNALPVLGMQGVTITPVTLPVRTSAYDLSFEFTEVEGGLACELHYNAGLFSEARIRRLGEHWRTLVSSMVAEPTAPLHRVAMLPPAERAALSGSFARVESPGPGTLVDAVRERVAREPEALAVVCGEARLTLAELDRGANRIARYLLEERKLRRGGVVAVVASRTERIPVALVGVLKAGGLYLPIDAEYPVERVRFMLSDSRAEVVLADARWAGLLAGGETPVVELGSSALAGVASDPGLSCQPDDVAALIYTSGSTGTPKGVMMEHRGLLNTAREFNRLCGVEPVGRILQFASLAFDAALLEMTMSLVGGAPLVVAGREVIENTSAFTEYLETHQVSFAILPPVYLSALERHELPTLRTLVTAGEAANAEDAKWYAKRKRYINAYGPAECSVCVSMYEVKEGEEYARGIPVGQALRNVGVVVADGELNALPVGVVGEVCVRGVGVARGYLGRPELTAEKFVEHAEYGRVYRTGDLGRWSEQGQLEFVGRKDGQVKIRGQRVEVEEVRRRVLSLVGVEEAVVLVEEVAGGKELAAYVVGSGAVSEGEVRRWVGQGLPAAMVPGRVRVLEQLPLTANGKVDREALRRWEQQQPRAGAAEESRPRTEAEQVLAEAWQRVLGVERVGLRENYFELGGDSIKAIRVSSEVRKKGWQVEVRQVFMHPTVEELSVWMKRRKEERREEGKGEVELTPIQKWLLERVEVKHRDHFNNAVMLKMEQGERVEVEGLKRALKQVEKQHEALRLRWREEGGKVRQWYGEEQEGEREWLEEKEVGPGEGWQQQLEQEAERLQRSLSLEKGPVWRAGLVRTPEGERVLWVVHHVSVDAVSWGVLVEDLASAYRQAVEGAATVVLPERSDSFQAWSRFLHSYADNVNPSERSYWSEVERALSSVPSLRGEGQGARGRNQDSGSVELVLSPERTRLLLGNANRAYNTQAGELVFAALARALQAWMGSHRMAFAMEGHGRTLSAASELDVSRTVGWFTCLYPVVLALPTRDDIGQHIKQVKETLRAVPEQGIGYGVLRQAGLLPRSEQEPQISFNYLGQSEGGASPAPFALAPESTGTMQHPEASRLFDIDILASVAREALRVDISFDTTAFARTRIQELVTGLQRELEHVITHCTTRDAPELTPSDIDYAGLSIDELDAVMNAISGK
ncbi:non-ribosomal peptide synthetase [Hyalangium versicolor]|uniref:non-ribosomal peptide synthetase n=1 Tax=Hyalangium versicolor TaxID=2861190 RepID=UPI001CCFABEB|nr:non-ribosomal peptide synthetase [Hyalangium versicolor]